MLQKLVDWIFPIKSSINLAKRILEPLLDEYPENIQIHEKLGSIYFISQDYDKVINIAEQAKSIQGNSIELSYILGKAYVEVKKYQEALEELRKVMERDQNYKNAPYFYYLCLGKVGN